MNPYFQLAQYILPAELFTHFELCRIEEDLLCIVICANIDYGGD